MPTRSERSPSARRADLIQVSLEDLHFTPLYDLVSHLVYVTDEQDVVSVVVDGKVLMRGGEVLTVDVTRVRSEATALAERIRASVVEKDAPPDQYVHDYNCARIRRLPRATAKKK